MTTLTHQQTAARSIRPRALASAVWHALASLRLALVLISALAVVVFAGTLLGPATPAGW